MLSCNVLIAHSVGDLEGEIRIFVEAEPGFRLAFRIVPDGGIFFGVFSHGLQLAEVGGYGLVLYDIYLSQPVYYRAVAPGSGKTFAGPNIPLGVGLKYKVKNRINLGCEFSFRKLFGDGLDVTDDSNAFLDDPYHMKGSFLKNKDWYSFLLFTVTWDFGPRCRTCNNAKNIDNIQ